MKFICLDLGTKTGWALSGDQHGVEDISPVKARKGKPGSQAKISKRDGRILKSAVEPVPPSPAEPDDIRLWKLWRLLDRLAITTDSLIVVHEGPLPHHASGRAAQLAFWAQATVALWCMLHQVRRVEVTPLDLQRHALGRKATPKSNEMLDMAIRRLGYKGCDPDEADALWLLDWARKYVPISEEDVK